MFQPKSVSPFLLPERVSIAVIGPDGAGKTTVLDWIEEALGPACGGDVLRRHLRPHRIPSRGEWQRGRRDRNDGRPNPLLKAALYDPYSVPLPSPAWSLLRLMWFVADNALGAVAPLPGRVILFDRHVDDLWIDPRRHRLNLPVWLIRATVAPLPRADLTILLQGDASVIAARKGEQTVAEARRQMARASTIAGRKGRVAVLTTDESEEVTRSRLLALLHDRFGATMQAVAG